MSCVLLQVEQLFIIKVINFEICGYFLYFRNATFGHGSPASKSQKLDLEDTPVKDEDTSDIEVED